MESNFINFLLEMKVPVIILMGFAIVYLGLEIRSYKKIIAKKDEQLNKLAEKTITVASLWDVKSDLNTKEHDAISKLLNDVRDDVKTIKDHTDV